MQREVGINIFKNVECVCRVLYNFCDINRDSLECFWNSGIAQRTLSHLTHSLTAQHSLLLLFVKILALKIIIIIISFQFWFLHMKMYISFYIDFASANARTTSDVWVCNFRSKWHSNWNNFNYMDYWCLISYTKLLGIDTLTPTGRTIYQLQIAESNTNLMHVINCYCCTVHSRRSSTSSSCI